MAEQTFKSPGFFEKEIDLTVREAQVSGTPAGIVGTSQQGPAFIPVTVGSFSEFVSRFGNLNSDYFGPYAVNEWLKNRTALTYVRVLGAGANETASDITTTISQGTVKNAGFVIKGQAADSTGNNGGNAIAGTKSHAGAVQFIVANHQIHNSSQESSAYPIFTDNDSFGSGQANIVRGMVFLSTGSRLQILSSDRNYDTIRGVASELTTGSISSYDGSKEEGTFKLVISSSAGSGFATTEGNDGIKIFTASLDPKSDHYIDKILNTDPKKFQTEQHLLYASFPVQSQIARVQYHASNGTVAILSGSEDFRDKFGRFDTRYSNSKTTSFISQPFGTTEYDLFHFETLEDGEYTSRKVKISIANLRRSNDPLNPYGTFDVYVRNYYDTDLAPEIIEQFNDCNLNPDDENYVGSKIGDYKVYYNFDAVSDDEKRIVTSGKYPNNSKYVRIVMNGSVANKNIPKSTLPFGFRGIPVLLTNSSLKDEPTGYERLTGNLFGTADVVKAMSGSIIPPLPMTIKATRGAVKQNGSFFGQKGDSESSDSRIYWGIKNTKLASSASLTNSALYTNAGGEYNELLDSYVKLLGIEKLGMTTTGSASDTFNNNKFSLSKIGFYNQTSVAELTGSASDHIVEAAYIRNAIPNANTYTVSDGTLTDRLSFGTLVSNSDTKYFNRFSPFLKFTNIFYGGFDGVNILDPDQSKLNNKSVEPGTGGKGNGSSSDSYLGLNSDSSPGTGLSNNYVASYRSAIKILTDEMSSRINILAVPGIRADFVTDYAAERVQEYGKAIYIMDIPFRDDSGNIIFDGSTTIPSVRETSENFEGRSFDNNFVATYFPNVTIIDEVNNGRLLSVPSSIAALGAIGFTDSVSYPWFAPAGFNRGSLDFVVNTQCKLTANDRDTLYESRINPITSFPNSGFVIFGQKTLQYAKSSLDRVNVRRMLLEVRRLVEEVAIKIVFEQNNQATRNRFISLITPLLSTIQNQQGIDSFRVVMDDSNNTPIDAEQNRLNGRIVLVPTRAIEFIAIDFIVTNSGVSFE